MKKKSKIKKVANGKVSKSSAMNDLKEEILSEARKLASGKISTAYPLVQKTLELIELEKSGSIEVVSPADFQ